MTWINRIAYKTSWCLFATLSIAIGLYPVIYFLIDRKFGLLSSKRELLLTDTIWNIGFYTHILLGGVALLIGWIQFVAKFRLKNLKLHGTIGKIYVVSVVLSGTAGIYIAYFATGGIVSTVGFMMLGVIWLTTTILSFLYIKNGDVKRHQKMMIYSYAACFAAVTLRIWLPLLIMYFGTFEEAYRIVAWLCWVPNMVIAFYIINRSELSLSLA